MEQFEPISDGRNAALPPPAKLPARPEPTWDPEKAARRKVRVVKVPYDQDPMKEKTVFEFNGFVYICYAKKTRGRSMIRCLGMAEVESAPPPLTPYEAGKILDSAKQEVTGDDVDGIIKEASDDDIIDEAAKEAEGD